MSLTYGELCAGYGGLFSGVQSVLGGDLKWYSEFDAAPSKVMAYHHPNVPNIGDMTKVDWTTVEPVDVLAGGTPCQDLSHAGKRAGMTEGTRSNLWVQMREAVNVLRPKLVVWENVRGALSAEAASDLEPCPGCLGDPGDGQPVLRALGRVLGDLAELGYDARWYGLRAADVGAAHGRFRVFLFATPADTDSAGRREHGRPFAVRPEHAPTQHAGAAPDGLTLLPTPEAADGSGGRKSAEFGGHRESGAKRSVTLATAVDHRWGDYSQAITRWEHVIGRPAPEPTETGAKGNPRLSPKFCEWLMGLPAGHVTSEDIGLTRNEMLRALGNGVVPTQAAAATKAFISDTSRGA